MKVFKYFWDLNERALKETENILRNPRHPKFIVRMVTFLSRCDKPQELFALISKKEFVENWPRIRAHWLKFSRQSDFRDWWETVYEQLLETYGVRQKKPEGESSGLFLKIGTKIRETRVNKGWTQNELAFKAGMRQPDISKIEEGKKNVTLETLAALCKVLEIKNIDLIV